MTLVRALQNFRSWGTRQRYWWTYPESNNSFQTISGPKDKSSYLPVFFVFPICSCSPLLWGNWGATGQSWATDLQFDPATSPWLLPIEQTTKNRCCSCLSAGIFNALGKMPKKATQFDKCKLHLYVLWAVHFLKYHRSGPDFKQNFEK